MMSWETNAKALVKLMGGFATVMLSDEKDVAGSVVISAADMGGHLAGLTLADVKGHKGEDWADVQSFGDRLNVVVDVEHGEERLRTWLERSGIESKGLRKVQPSLENVFIWLLKHEEQPVEKRQ